MLKAGHDQSETATILGGHKSTNSRERRRNRGQRGYRPTPAQELAVARHRAAYRPRITAQTWQQVEVLLRQEWSPEQTAGRLKLEQHLTGSHERIYRDIDADKRAGGTLDTHLRCQKQRRKRYGADDRRGRLPHCRSIETRPAIVAAKRRVGDGEAATIIGSGHSGALVTVTERRSKLLLMQRVADKSAATVEQAVTTLLRDVGGQVHTLTSDNGREFATHQALAEQLAADFYFAHPYASWERGLNENTNGLIRHYFPKARDLTTVTDEEVRQAQQRLNPRPRKTLGYKTPYQVFYKRAPVALQS